MIKGEIMKKRIIKVFLFVAVFTMSFMISNTDSQAASKKWKKACKAYKTFLAKNESRFVPMEFDYETQNKENYKKTSSFLIVDLNKDGTPELVTHHVRGFKDGCLYIFQYKGGKVVPLKRNGKVVSIDITCTAMGYYNVSKCKKGHLHVDWFSGMGVDDSTYRIRKGKLEKYLNYRRIELSDTDIDQSIKKSGKKISKKTYKYYISKCGSKRSYLIDNNKANRKNIMSSKWY